MVGVRLDRKRKQNVTVLLKALGMTIEDIRREFADPNSTEGKAYESIELTLEKDHTLAEDDALLDIYRKLRPGEPPTREAAQTLLNNYYFNPKRYDLAKVGRYKVNKKLGLVEAFDQQTLTLTTSWRRSATSSRCTTARPRSSPPRATLEISADDIDHFGNRRMRTVGELIQNQLRTGLARMERVVRERMTTQDVEAITPQSLINIRPVVAALKEFFGTSQLSQFMDQTNPIAGLTHKRRLNALGPGGLSRDRAGMEVRDVHPSHYGRMCPIETPEGPEHRPDRLARVVRPDQPVRLRRDALPQGREGQDHRPGRLPHRRRRGPLRHRPGQRHDRRQGQVHRRAGAGPPARR